MPEALTRWSIAVACGIGAIVLVIASASMNYLSWRGQAGDAGASQILGAISIVFDGFKAVLPIVIGWALTSKRLFEAAVAAIFFCGCLAFALYGALGLANEARIRMTGMREAAQLRHAAAARELAELDRQISALGTMRPQTVVAQLIEQGKQDRRWITSSQCNAAVSPSMRAYCAELAALRTEQVTSVTSAQLQVRAKLLQAEIGGLLSSGVRSNIDGHAEFVAQLFGFPIASVQTGRSLLVTLLLEFGAAFGLLIAALPLSTRTSQKAQFIPPRTGDDLANKSRRIIRSDGRLMIEVATTGRHR